LIPPRYTKVFFFFFLLISFNLSKLNAQVSGGDTLKKVRVDTLAASDENEQLDGPINYTAEDSVVALQKLGRVLLYGKAKVVYGAMDMQAQVIEIDYRNNLVLAYGKKDSSGKLIGTPVFKEGSETPIEAEKIMYNLKTKKGKIFSALTKQGELLVVGNEIKKDSTDIIYMKNMRCIPCQEEDARTVFKASKAKIIPDDKIVTGPMFLEIGGVATPLGLPFGYFPNTKRQHNGILLPLFGNSAERGFNLQGGGYYWGINDRTDMIIKGDIYANGSWVLNTTNNYNVLYKASGNTFLSYSHYNIGDRDVPQTFSEQTAYQINWIHNQDNKSDPSSRFNANVDFRNNQTFNRFNSVNSGQYLQNTFQSNVNYTKTFKLSSLSINAMHSQNSLNKQMDITLPQLTYNVNRFFPFKRKDAVKQNVFDKIGINYLLEAKNILSGPDSTIFKGSILDSVDYGVRHSLPISTNFNLLKYITVTPAVNLSSVMYTKNTRKEFYKEKITQQFAVSDSAYTRDTILQRVRTINDKKFAAGYDANFSTGMSTKVYSDYLFTKGKIKQIRHLLIPTLAYTYRPDFGEDKYGFYKTVARDTIGHTERYSIFQSGIFGGPSGGQVSALSLGLNNNLEAKVKQQTDTGVTFKKVVILQNLGLNGSYNLAADSFKMSNVNLSGRTVLFKYFDITMGAGFDPYVYNQQAGTRVNRYVNEFGPRIARMTSARLTVNTSIGSDMLQALKKTRQSPTQTNGAERGAENDLDPTDKLPWNLRTTYVLDLSNPRDQKLQPSHTLNFAGDLMPTKYWKIGVSSGFDFTSQKVSYTSLNIYRDLKCWEARIDWVPFGPNKRYYLTLNLKSSMLRDIKIPKQSLPRLQNFEN
jgi:hypothetical protein